MIQGSPVHFLKLRCERAGTGLECIVQSYDYIYTHKFCFKLLIFFVCPVSNY